MQRHTIQSLEGFIAEQLFLEFNSRITKTYLENNWNYIMYGRDNFIQILEILMKKQRHLESIEDKFKQLKSEIYKYNSDYRKRLLELKKKLQNEINTTSKFSE